MQNKIRAGKKFYISILFETIVSRLGYVEQLIKYNLNYQTSFLYLLSFALEMKSLFWFNQSNIIRVE